MEAWCCESWCSQLKANFLKGWGMGEQLRAARAGTAPSRVSLHMEFQAPQAWKSKRIHYSLPILRIWGAGGEISCWKHGNPAGNAGEARSGAKLSCWCLLLATIPHRGLEIPKKKKSQAQIQGYFFHLSVQWESYKLISRLRCFRSGLKQFGINGTKEAKRREISISTPTTNPSPERNKFNFRQAAPSEF